MGGSGVGALPRRRGMPLDDRESRTGSWNVAVGVGGAVPEFSRRAPDVVFVAMEAAAWRANVDVDELQRGEDFGRSGL